IARIAASTIRTAALLRYECIAAAREHARLDREWDARIAEAPAQRAAKLTDVREQMRCAGKWVPTLPGGRDMRAILRYEGCLEQELHHALEELRSAQSLRKSGFARDTKAQKQSDREACASGRPERSEGPSRSAANSAKQTHLEPTATSALSSCEGPPRSDERS